MNRICILVVLALSTAATASADFASAKAYFGAWRDRGGNLVVVGRSDDALFIFDEARAHRRRAHLAADGRTLVAEGARLSLADDDLLTGTVDGHTVRVRRVPLSREEVQWTAGGVTLAGTLWRPAGHAPTPGVVLVQGSGPETRWAMRQFPAWLAAHGMTVIAYDKRARWQPWEAGIDVLANDALGAVALLRARPDVEPARVGLLGISNGAFVAVHAAARSATVAFVIPVVGGGGPLWRHELYRVHNAGLEAGLDTADVAALDAFMKALYRPETFAAGKAPQLGALLARARGQRWLKLTPVAPFADTPLEVAFSVGQKAWAKELSYDPATDLERLHGRSALFLLGGADRDVDPTLCATEVKRHAPSAEVLVLPRASHYLLLPTPPPSDREVALSPRLFTALAHFVASTLHACGPAGRCAAAPARPLTGSGGRSPR